MQPIFSRNVDYNKIAFLNWRIAKETDIINVINIADGYLSSAISLVRLCLINNKNKQADIVIFPIINSQSWNRIVPKGYLQYAEPVAG